MIYPLIKTVSVYCAASNRMDDIYFVNAEKLGHIMGQRHFHIINGAGNVGLMRVITDAVLFSGGTVTGVIPQFMVDRGLCHANLTKVIRTQTMHERKKTMADLSDASIALPGWYGTMEELLEIIAWRQLGLYDKPVIILNTNHFFDPLFEMLSRAVAEKFVREKHARLWYVAQTPEEAIEYLDHAK